MSSISAPGPDRYDPPGIRQGEPTVIGTILAPRPGPGPEPLAPGEAEPATEALRAESQSRMAAEGQVARDRLSAADAPSVPDPDPALADLARLAAEVRRLALVVRCVSFSVGARPMHELRQMAERDRRRDEEEAERQAARSRDERARLTTIDLELRRLRDGWAGRTTGGGPVPPGRADRTLGREERLPVRRSPAPDCTVSIGHGPGPVGRGRYRRRAPREGPGRRPLCRSGCRTRTCGRIGLSDRRRTLARRWASGTPGVPPEGRGSRGRHRPGATSTPSSSAGEPAARC